ncbi:Protein ALP1-like [Linum perenne]
MNRRLFKKLRELLVSEGGLKSSRHVDVDEMLVMFLHTIGHNTKNRVLQEHFCRSGETIGRHLHCVLRAIVRLHPILLCKPEPIPENSDDFRWKHFKNCSGALDATHIKVRVRREDQPRYRDRKGDLSINVLAVCNPNMQFIYYSAGWEGSAHDGRVLRDALSRPNGFRVPQGNYYLCDAWYANSEGFLTPFRGQRYHLSEWGSNQPNTPEEYYKMKHAKARNVIDRVFAALKMRWALLRDTTWFPTDVIADIVNACCLLHNFIEREKGSNEFEDMEAEPVNLTNIVEDVESISSIQPTPEWAQFRNAKAQEMWQNRTRQ